MNRLLEKVFVSFSSQTRPDSYYSYPEGSKEASVVFQVVYQGTKVIDDGRVVLYFAPTADPSARYGAFEGKTPMLAKDVTNVKPGDMIEFDSTEYSVPEALALIPRDLSAFTSTLFVQALFNTTLDDPLPNLYTGNVVSEMVPVKIEPTPGALPIVKIVADQVISYTMDVSNSEWMECIEMKSQLLSEYHNKDVFMYAAVVLPKGYHQRPSNTKYPTVYYIEGFMGTEFYADRARAFLNSEMGDDWKEGRWPTPMIRVTLGSRFKFGHTSFSDTEVNGPWGSALVSEFIPYLESKFAMLASGSGRFLHGHSSGGWATLWLQLHNPDFFGGTWSTSPDPVDFTKFQLINIYEADNAFWDPYGRPYPFSRADGAVESTVRDGNLYERVAARGNGGQWDTFFAAFGPRDVTTGLPIPLFDKLTGAIDRDVAAYWARYDICKLLRDRGDTILPRLTNKIHVTCGTEDSCYLDRACQSLQKIIGRKPATLTTSNYVDMIPGDHNSIRNRKHYQTIYKEIALAHQQLTQQK
ncbi:hypothetical protein Poli38472_002603 [Pythium oligandrum]|uniref:Esterase n=1 Tax=Pythium oligandrum TaxID=41045 RepID=A0A8K1FLB1_PYTOL|nr:hypothetical protein Poli38472_002603 [Pythium oligandrum]|eukprot:TMW63662.1 hypothetical protein Poli38472_002603 [Pythium oligandrum]